MAIPGVLTSQTGCRRFDGHNMCNYSLFMGGVNATHHALENYSPMQNGYGRLFMVRAPLVMLRIFGGPSDAHLYSKDNGFVQFKHMMEYMNAGVQGFQEKKLEVADTPIKGGFAGRSFKTPTITKSDMDTFTVKMYELTGCPVRDVIDQWMNAIGDENSGFAHYGGWISGGRDAQGYEKRIHRRSDESEYGIPYNEANHTAEFIYVVTDKSGAQVESAVMLAGCFPTGINEAAVLNYEAGVHDNVTYDLTFNCVMYRSIGINAIANDLLKQYLLVTNSLNFNPELGDAMYASAEGNNFVFRRSLGQIPTDSATGTNIGNVPAFDFNNAPTTRVVDEVSVDALKMSNGYQLPDDWGGEGRQQFSKDWSDSYVAQAPPGTLSGSAPGASNENMRESNMGYTYRGLSVHEATVSGSTADQGQNVGVNQGQWNN